MKALKVSFLIIFMLTLTSVLSFSETYTHAKSGFKIWLPDNWKASGDDDTLSAADPTGQVQFVFAALPDAKTAKAAVDEMEKELSKVISNPKTSQLIEGNINGCDVIAVDGTGVTEGIEMTFSVLLYHNSKNNHILMVFGVTASQFFPTHQPTMVKILKSITK